MHIVLDVELCIVCTVRPVLLDDRPVVRVQVHIVENVRIPHSIAGCGAFVIVENRYCLAIDMVHLLFTGVVTASTFLVKFRTV